MRSTSRLSAEQEKKMCGTSWHEDIPSPRFSELRLLTIPYLDFGGNEQEGEIVTVSELAPQVHKIFAALHELHFPIASMRLICEFEGDDGASMAANNTSCFNSRRIINSTRLSMHAMGRAIDINPIQNPVIRDGVVRPDAGRAYQDRSVREPGMFYPGAPALQVFYEEGWKWGGDWDTPKDYHHLFLPSEQ